MDDSVNIMIMIRKNKFWRTSLMSACHTERGHTSIHRAVPEDWLPAEDCETCRDPASESDYPNSGHGAERCNPLGA